jgi:SAM-dependent methyltransferase
MRTGIMVIRLLAEWISKLEGKVFAESINEFPKKDVKLALETNRNYYQMSTLVDEFPVEVFKKSLEDGELLFITDWLKNCPFAMLKDYLEKTKDKFDITLLAILPSQELAKWLSEFPYEVAKKWLYSNRKNKPILEWLVEAKCVFTSGSNKMAHMLLKSVQWEIPPMPESFDHHIDVAYTLLECRQPQFLERGLSSSLALKGRDVLELCCGDGFNARHFYSIKSKNVVACDFDAKAIVCAKRKNETSNVVFKVADIRTQMPEGVFGNIILDAAIEHFTRVEIKALMENIKARLEPGGIFSGHSLVEHAAGGNLFAHHEIEFHKKEDLLDLLSPFFFNVIVYETINGDRHNLMFWASDAIIPFGHNWQSMCKVEKITSIPPVSA